MSLMAISLQANIKYFYTFTSIITCFVLTYSCQSDMCVFTKAAWYYLALLCYLLPRTAEFCQVLFTLLTTYLHIQCANYTPSTMI